MASGLSGAIVESIWYCSLGHPTIMLPRLGPYRVAMIKTDGTGATGATGTIVDDSIGYWGHWGHSG